MVENFSYIVCLTIPGLVVTAGAVPVAKAITPVARSAPNRLAAIPLLAVAVIAHVGPAMRLIAVLISWSGRGLDVDERQSRPVAHAVGARDNDQVIHDSRVDLTEHGVQVLTCREPIRSGRVG